VSRYEDAIAERTGRSYVHAVCTGSAANQAALAGVGIGPGDEVIVPPCSYIASSLSVVALGAIPVFADVDPQTLHMTAEGSQRESRGSSTSVGNARRDWSDYAGGATSQSGSN